MRTLMTLLVMTALVAPIAAQDNEAPSQADQAEQVANDKITLNVRDTSLGQVIELISVQQQVNIVAGIDTNRPVTVNFFDASLEEALDWVLGPLGLGWYFDGKVYTILEADQVDLIQRPLEEKIFRLNYRSAAEMQTYLVKFLSPHGSVVISETPVFGVTGGKDTTGGINSTMQEMLIVIDNRDAIDRIGLMVAELDTRPRQVLVEATIIQVVLDETNRFGVDINLLVDADFSDFGDVLDPQRIFSDGVVTPADTGSLTQAGFTDGPGASGLRIGFVGSSVSAFLEALQSTVDTNVLANTEVLALNKMKGEIIIGGRLGYFGGTTVSDGISQQTVEFLEVGTQLRFRPFIGDDGFVRLEIHPERSSGVVDPTTGLPSESTSEVTTNVMVRDDETIVIGGLIETREVKSVSRVPILGYIPLIGWLFSKEITEVERSEIIIMLTPHILEDGEIYEDGQLLIDDARAKSEVFVDGFGPVSRRSQATRYLEETKQALGNGNLNEARALCDRVIALDPLADGVVQLSLEIDAQIADRNTLDNGPAGRN
jgi:type IV pilus assembly protein PilQ